MYVCKYMNAQIISSGDLNNVKIGSNACLYRNVSLDLANKIHCFMEIQLQLLMTKTQAAMVNVRTSIKIH